MVEGARPTKADELITRLDLNEERLKKWHDVIEKIYLHIAPNGLIEQFEGYYQRRDIDSRHAGAAHKVSAGDLRH